MAVPLPNCLLQSCMGVHVVAMSDLQVGMAVVDFLPIGPYNCYGSRNLTLLSAAILVIVNNYHTHV